MADADFDGFEAYEGRGYGRQGSAADRRAPPQETLGARFQALANGAGALTSVALVVGIGIWGYKLAVRDVTGIPVVRALQGPARIAPADPGGDFAGHQGLAVNEIAADGVAPPAPDRLTLAPRAEGLAGEDRPMGELVPTPVPAVARPRTPGIVTPLSDAGGAASAVTPPLAGEPLPDGPALDAGTEDALLAPAEATPATAIPADVPGVSQSPVPAARPATLASAAGVVSAAPAADGSDAMAEAAAAAVAEALAPAGTVDLAAAELAPGTRLAQIGAYANADDAEAAWDAALGRFGALMDGKRRVIETAESGGQTFYRLRVEGFADLDDARRFCAALMADNAECVPTTVR